MTAAAPIAYLRSATLPAGAFLPKKDIAISPDDRGFTLADGVYEVIRSYQGRMFEAAAHFARLRHSLAAVSINLTDFESLPATALELLRLNRLQQSDAVIYLQVTRGSAPRALPFPVPVPLPTVYACASVLPADDRERANGIAVITVPDTRWRHCDIKSIGLLPNVLAHQAAIESGAAEALFIRDGVITEGTHTSVFAVCAGRVATHPADERVLPGITRSVVLELCRRLNISTSESPVKVADLPACDELFLACTTAEILPVVMIDGSPVSHGVPGPVTRRLQSTFHDYVRSVAGTDTLS